MALKNKLVTIKEVTTEITTSYKCGSQEISYEPYKQGINIYDYSMDLEDAQDLQDLLTLLQRMKKDKVF